MTRHYLTIAIGLALLGCRNEPAAVVPPPSSNALESAAREAGLVDDPASVLPTGLFENRHAVGTDSLCLKPVSGNRYRFGTIAAFGATLRCEGKGAAVHSGPTVALTFDDAQCAFVAAYDGRAIHFPGVVPAGCAALCGPRASLSGVSFDRSGWAVADAHRLRSRDPRRVGQRLCE